MDTPLPPLPADLWPKVAAVTTSRQPDQGLMLEVQSLSERPVLGALARAIHAEMHGAGEWAARITAEPDKGYPGPREFYRLHAEDASRLLAAYTALYHAVDRTDSLILSPESLKEAASRRYQIGLRDEAGRQQKQSGGFNDALYDTVKNKAPGERPKF